MSEIFGSNTGRWILSLVLKRNKRSISRTKIKITCEMFLFVCQVKYGMVMWVTVWKQERNESESDYLKLMVLKFGSPAKWYKM